jgi:ABC-2 type transport system permease protein
MRYIRLLGLFLKANLLVELEYRANFAAQSALGILWAGLTFVSVAVFFTQTDALGGWTYEQALIIVALFTIISGAVRFILEPNVIKIVEMVRTGAMDFVLTKPANSQFLATLRYAQYAGLADIAAGSAIIGFALHRMQYVPDPIASIQFALMLISALAIVYSIWLVMAALSFWFVKIESLSELFYALFDTARFPVTTYPGLVRLLLTFVLPVAFMTTFPAQAMLGLLDSTTLAISLGLAVLLVLFSAWLWQRAVLGYSSASS